MKWTDYRELKNAAKLSRHSSMLVADCLAALDNWNKDFPDRWVSPKLALPLGTLAFWIFLSHWARTRKAYPSADFHFAPEDGKDFISELAFRGPLAWGWRSPAREKAKGTLRRGLLQIINDHFDLLGERGRILLFLACTDLRGKSLIAFAREYQAWSGDKSDVNLLARAINERVTRIPR